MCSSDLKPEEKTGLFARIAQSSDDEANLVVGRDRSCFALLNRYPYNGGHLMVVPYKEVADLNGLTDEEVADLWKLVRRCLNALTAAMKPDGFNVSINIGLIAGAGITEVVHYHIVPRWAGDTNLMPVLADVRVIREHLRQTREQLALAFLNLYTLNRT